MPFFFVGERGQTSFFLRTFSLSLSLGLSLTHTHTLSLYLSLSLSFPLPPRLSLSLSLFFLLSHSLFHYVSIISRFANSPLSGVVQSAAEVYAVNGGMANLHPQ